MDQVVDGAELRETDRLAKVLGSDEPRVKNLHQYVRRPIDEVRAELGSVARGAPR